DGLDGISVHVGRKVMGRRHGSLSCLCAPPEFLSLARDASRGRSSRGTWSSSLGAELDRVAATSPSFGTSPYATIIRPLRSPRERTTLRLLNCAARND